MALLGGTVDFKSGSTQCRTKPLGTEADTQRLWPTEPHKHQGGRMLEEDIEQRLNAIRLRA